MIRNCEELRLQILATSLFLGKSFNDEIIEHVLLDRLGIDPYGEMRAETILYGSCGLVSSQVGRNRIVMLPRIESEEQGHNLYNDLNDILNKTESGSAWIVDFSAIVEMPLLLLTNIAYFAEKLERKKSKMYLCWLKPNLFSPEQLERVKKRFDLTLIGGNLFTGVDGSR